MADQWRLRSTEKGTVDVTMVKWSGKSLNTEMKPDQLGAFVAGLSTAFREAQVRSGKDPLPDGYQATTPTVEPDAVGLLNPTPNEYALLVSVGDGRIVINLSNLDKEDLQQLGRSLRALGADTKLAN